MADLQVPQTHDGSMTTATCYGCNQDFPESQATTFMGAKYCPECELKRRNQATGEINIAEPGPSSPSEPKPQYVGIRGWLILPAIGLIIGSIISVISLIISFTMFSEVSNAGYGGLYSLEILVEVGLSVFIVYTAVRFFGKKSNAPSIFIKFMIASIVASGVLLLIELSAGAQVFAIESGKTLVRSIVGAAIWIPYFRKSKRVNATFVN
jgi:hypothetical protein